MPLLAGRPIQNLALAIGATLAVLLACEGVARLFLPPPRYHREPVAFDPLLGFRGIPGHRQEGVDELGRYAIELNAQGLRGREIPAEPEPAPEGALRVVFVGDSFLVGQAVREEQLVTSLVEAGLRSRGREAEVYNLSGIDWGTAQELLALRALGRPLVPDAVVLFVYPANDWINNSMLLAGRTTVSAGDAIRPYLVPEGGELRLRHLDPLRAFLRGHSRLFAVLERRVLATTAGRTPASEDAGARLREGRAPREDLELFRSHDPGDRWEQAWGTSLELLRAFRDECTALGARLLVVVVPSVHQVVVTPKAIGLDVTVRLARRRPLDALLDWDLPERRLAAFFAAERIESLLLLRPLREGARRGGRVYARDEHLASLGHKIAAAPIVDWILSERPAGGSALPELGSGPVALLPDAATAPALLDFHEDRHQDYLGDGWISWGPTTGGGGAWLIGPSALAVLPLRDGDLVLRGWAPREARFPIEGQIAVVGGPRHPIRIEEPGRFVLRYPGSTRDARAWPTAGGYLALVLAPGETHRAGPVPGGFYVEALGFEAAPVREADGG